MRDKDLSREARAGMIATVLLLALGYTVSMLSSIEEQKEWGTPYNIVFNRVEGIEEGSEVYFAGRYVGRIRRLWIRPSDQRVVATIAIAPFRNAQLTYQSHYRIAGRLFGERWINIEPEDGDPVPPNGEVAGESVPRFTHVMQHGIQALEQVESQLEGFKAQYGKPAEIRARMMNTIKRWNDTAFYIRANVNNFNKFSGLAKQRMDEIASAIAERARRARARVNTMTEQMRVYSAMLRTRAVEGEVQMQTMVNGMRGKVVALQAYVDRANTFLSEQKKWERMLAGMRRKTEEYEEIAEALRLISSNPALAKQLKGGLKDLREQARKMRESFGVKSTEPQAPSPSPSAAPQETGPSAPEPSPSPTVMPAAPLPTPENG